MMNKYITALFIVLAATGVESQTYQSLLNVAVKHSSLEDFCNHLELKGLGAEVLSVIEVYKNITKEDEIDYTTTYLLLSNRRNAKYYVVRLSENLKRTISYYLPAPSTHSSILIRAPSYFIS